MFGKFIFECDTEYFDDAVSAAKEILGSAENQCMTSAVYSDGAEVQMFARRLKRSISVKQVKP
jgi:hypothetical protein